MQHGKVEVGVGDGWGGECAVNVEMRLAEGRALGAKQWYDRRGCMCVEPSVAMLEKMWLCRITPAVLRRAQRPESLGSLPQVPKGCC